MRPVADHHVDRTGVEAQQCVELTVTNSSIDLSQLFYAVCAGDGHKVLISLEKRIFLNKKTLSSETPSGQPHHTPPPMPGRHSGDHRAVDPPSPIPNLEVKRCIADDSAEQSVRK